MLAACKPEQHSSGIQWQLPIAPPVDAHAKAEMPDVPAWARHEGVVQIIALQKSTARRFVLRLPLDGTPVAGPGGWQLRALGAAKRLRWQDGQWLAAKEGEDNPAAIVEFVRDGRLVYRGWLFANFPELFGPQDRDWKFWLVGITFRPAEKAAHP